MMTPEETRVLNYLRRKCSATVTDVAAACLSGASPDWVNRVISSLDWFGYLTIYYARDGAPEALQITDKGMSCSPGSALAAL